MAVSSTHAKPPQTHAITTIIVTQVDVVMRCSSALRAASEVGLARRFGGAAEPDNTSGENGPRKVARGGWGCKRKRSVLQPDHDPRQQLGKVVRSGRVNHGRDRRLRTEILNLDPELD